MVQPLGLYPGLSFGRLSPCAEMFGKIMVALTLVIGTWELYWYGYRPKHVRAECEAEAIVHASSAYQERSMYDVQASYAPGAYRAEDKDQAYSSCLRRHGI